jgi:hypothetical protein
VVCSTQATSIQAKGQDTKESGGQANDLEKLVRGLVRTRDFPVVFYRIMRVVRLRFGCRADEVMAVVRCAHSETPADVRVDGGFESWKSAD